MSRYALIKQYYLNILHREPTALEQDHWSMVLSSGAMSETGVRDAIAASPEAVTYVDQIIRIYQAAFGREPDLAGLNGWTNLLRTDPTALTQVALGFVNSTEWMNRHGNNSVSDAVLQSLYQNVLGRIPSQAEIDAWRASGQPMTQILIGFSNSAEFQKTSAPRVTEIKQVIADTPLPPAPVETPQTPEPTPNPANFTLTTAADTYVGDDRDNTIDGIADGSVNQTFSAVDSIDGGDGNDTLKLINTSGTMTLSTAAVVKNVETVELRSSQNAVTANVNSWTGLQSVKVTQTGTAADVTVDTTRNVTSVSVTGGKVVSIMDQGAAGTDTITTTSLDGYKDNSAIQSDALTSLSLANSNKDVSVTAAAGTRTLDLTLNSMTGGTITDNQATAMTVTTSGQGSTSMRLTAGKASTLAIAGDKSLSLSGITLANDAAITSTNTAGVTITSELVADMSFSGGDGNDSVKVTSTTRAITLGNGDDSLEMSGPSLGTGGSIDGGDGTDTLVGRALNIANLAATTAFANAAKNFEVLSLNSAFIAGITLNIGNLNSGGANTITKVISTSNVNGTFTVNNLDSGGTIGFTTTNSATTTVNVTGAAGGTNDVLNISVSSSSLRDIKTVTAANVETINLLTDDTAATPVGLAHVAKIDAAQATTLTVSGDAGVYLTYAGTALTTFDASGVTKGNVNWTTDTLTNAVTIKGGAGNDTLNATKATKAVTLVGGAGNDILTGSSNDDTISGGDGDDRLTPREGSDIIDVGSGLDTVVMTAANANGTIFPSITGMGAGDKVQFISGTATFETTAITAGGSPSYADLLDAATNGAANRVVWFQFGGDTYLVHDRNVSTSFTDGSDYVVKLVGLYDLSTATINGLSSNQLTL